MGNSAPLQFVQLHFPPNTYHWQPFSNPSDTTTINSQKLLFDPYTKIIAQKHSIHEFSSLQLELNSFLFRKQQSSTLVTVYDILLSQTPSVIIPDCMVNQHNRSFSVILEKIPYRLTDIGVIKFQEMTYILEQCFKGLQALFAYSGKYYMVDEDLICFNSEGKCKIWINENLSKNTPNITAVFTQQSIIRQVLQTLESRLDMQPPNYYSKLKSRSTFTEINHVVNFIQKLRKKLYIETQCIQSIKLAESHKRKESDLAQAVNLQRNNQKPSVQKRTQKFSLKNSRNNTNLNKSIRPPKTNLSRQQTTQVSILELERRNLQEMEISRFLRSSFKSVSNPQKKRSIQFTEYSEKIKRKISPKKQRQNEKLQFNVEGQGFYGKFPKGVLFA